MKKLKAQWETDSPSQVEILDSEQTDGILLGQEVVNPPAWVKAESGVGHVTISWDSVEGIPGYIVLRSDSRDGEYLPVDHKGGDSVKAVPGYSYVDTTGEVDREYFYAVASVPSVEAPYGPMSEPVPASSKSTGTREVVLSVNAKVPTVPIVPIWRMVGSEHLSQIFSTEVVGGFEVGPDFLEALKITKSELGAERVRAHGIFLDELEIYQQTPHGDHFSFDKIDQVYDTLLDLGLRPIVELSFMPKAMTANPEPTVFHYRGHISKPSSWTAWSSLVESFVRHLVERYGLEEVRKWGFEVWNEPNLTAFWVDSSDDYFEMYKHTAKAVKRVDAKLPVGGPATAAAGWVLELIDYVKRHDLPLDFVATHLYGTFPLDFKQVLLAHGLPDTQVWWTEWGVTPTHFAKVNDSVFAAPFLLHGMKRSQSSADALAYWVLSDHFEELGRGNKLLHGGFGLLTVGNLRKPRFWAIKLAEELGTDALSFDMDGDGANGLVDGWATRKEDGSVDVLIWNGTLNQDQQNGCPLLDRTVRLKITNLPQKSYRVTLGRVDALHSNVSRAWNAEQDWPNESQWKMLRAADKLAEIVLEENLDCHDRTFEYTLDLPMPGIARVRLEPVK